MAARSKPVLRRRRAPLSLTAPLLGLVATACGAVAEDPAPAAPPPRSPPGFWPPDATDGPTPALLGDVLDVPAGFVRSGYWSYSDAKRSLFAAACDDPNPGVRTVRYRVAPFRMMRLEVTNRVYASCVAAGKCRPPDVDLSDDPFGPVPWDAPSRSERPVATSQIAARAFCRAYGGDLPTRYQWVRAAEGDSGAFGIAALTETWIRCRLGEALELCEALGNATWQRVPTKAGGPGYFPIASTTEAPWDVGPYGHRALFGGAGEWIRVDNARSALRGDCASEGLLTDDFIRASYESPPDEPTTVMQIARDLEELILNAPEAVRIRSVRLGAISEKAGSGRFFTGFRCAFPPKAP